MIFDRKPNYVNKIVLNNGEIIEEVSWLSNSGKNYVVHYRDEDGVFRDNKRIIKCEDIASIKRVKRGYR